MPAAPGLRRLPWWRLPPSWLWPGPGDLSAVTSAQHRATDAQAQITSLNSQVATTSDVTTVQAAVTAQKAVYASALAKEVDWTRLVEQLTGVLPPGVHLSTLAVQRQGVVVGPASAANASDGSLSVGVSAAGGPDAAANWLRALATLPSLQGTAVSTITQDKTAGAPPNAVTFSSSSSVTPAAESQRSVKAGVSK